jgi:hypothetical protein
VPRLVRFPHSTCLKPKRDSKATNMNNIVVMVLLKSFKTLLILSSPS